MRIIQLRTFLVCLAWAAVASGAWGAQKQRPVNFRVYGAGEQRQEFVDRCQQIRDELHARWNGDGPQIAWTPPCEIVLHQRPRDYLNAVGAGGRGTVGATYIQFDTRRSDRILRRRIDLLTAGQADPLAALPHELTHVLLADRFAGRQPPPWLDEGIATLADSHAKQERHLRDLRGALLAGRGMSVVQMLEHEGPIPSQQRAGFYGQSVALATVLTRLEAPSRIFEFAQETQRSGSERALKKVYRLELHELDRRIRELTLESDLALQP